MISSFFKKNKRQLAAFLGVLMLCAFVLPFVDINQTQAQQGSPTEGLGTGVVDPATESPAQDAANTSSTFDDIAALLTGFIDIGVLGIGEMLFKFGGVIFDAFIAASLSKVFMGNNEFVSFGWVIVRDIANTAFIFILLYIAIMTILQAGGTNTKQLLVSLIIAALFVNFSLYITRFVIDATDIVAYEFYKNTGSPTTSLKVVGIEARSLSSGLLGIVHSQVSQRVTKLQEQTGNNLKSLGLILISGIAYLVGFFILLSAGFLFLARSISLWFVMIFSPLAFVAAILPGAQNIWTKWKSTLISQSLMAPIFLFLLYLTFALLQNNAVYMKGLITYNNNGFLSSANAEFVKLIIEQLLPFIIFMGMLVASLGIAKGMSGKMGEVAEKYGKGAFGGMWRGGSALALGTAAVLGTNTFGRIAQSRLERMTDSERERLQKTRLGRMRLKGWDSLAAGSYDFRKSKLGGATLGAVDRGLAGQGMGTGPSLAKPITGWNWRVGTHATVDEDIKKLDALSSDEARANYIRKSGPTRARAIWNALPYAKRQQILEAAKKTHGLTESISDRGFLEELNDNMILGKDVLGKDEKDGGLGNVRMEEEYKERIKGAKADVDDKGIVTKTAEQKRMEILSNVADEKMRRRVATTMSTRDLSGMYASIGEMEDEAIKNPAAPKPPISQAEIRTMINKMGAEDQEKFNMELLKRETNMTKAMSHYVGISDKTVQQNVLNSLGTQNQLNLFDTAARTPGSPNDILMRSRVAGMDPSAQADLHKEILRRLPQAERQSHVIAFGGPALASIKKFSKKDRDFDGTQQESVTAGIINGMRGSIIPNGSAVPPGMTLTPMEKSTLDTLRSMAFRNHPLVSGQITDIEYTAEMADNGTIPIA